MVSFYKSYSDVAAIPPPLVAELDLEVKTDFETVFWSIPWTHHILLMEKVTGQKTRLWFMTETLKNGWSKNTLLSMINSKADKRKGKAVSNFGRLLPTVQAELAKQELKDPYIFDFLTLQEPFHESELELGLLKHLEQFLIELGQGFAFVGRQYYLEIEDNEYYLDLLFYHLKLRCFVVVELKRGKFKPEYAGKMNFYLNVVDDRLKNKTDLPSIGLILCQERNQIVAEYALRGVDRPIGVSQYELTRALPKALKSVLPTVEEIEIELSENIKPSKRKTRVTKVKKAQKTTKVARK